MCFYAFGGNGGNMEYALLIGVIVFLAGMFVTGYASGVIRILLSFIATIVAFLLALILAGPFSTFVKESTPIYDGVKKQMTEYVSEYISDEMDSSSETIQKDAIKDLKLPSSIKDKLVENYTADVKLEMAVDTFSEYLAASLADILVEAISVLILFIVIKLILRIIILLLNIISRLPIINGVNKTLGGFLGLAEGVLILWIMCIALTAFSGTNVGEQLLSAISSNEILNYIYSNNLVMKFLMK